MARSVSTPTKEWAWNPFSSFGLLIEPFLFGENMKYPYQEQIEVFINKKGTITIKSSTPSDPYSDENIISLTPEASVFVVSEIKSLLKTKKEWWLAKEDSKDEN